VVSTSPTLSSPIYSGFVSSSSATNFMTKFNVTGLQPNTQYY
jgi:phosphodiesterase/alkaline phosphatase D-like protein